MNKLKKITILFSLFSFVLFPALNEASAQDYKVLNAKNIQGKNIVIKGNERIDDAIVKSYLEISGIKNGNQKAIDESLRKLYQSDLFLKADIYKEGNQMVVELVENPIISEVKFIGNKKIEDDVLQAEISLKKREIFTKSKLQNDIKRINDIYVKSGRFLTKIEPKIIQKEQNRVELIFDIFEGKKADIADINFIGNDNYSSQDLIDEMTTKKTKWYKFLSSADTYDSDRIDFDKEKLRRFYNNNGYADFNVISSVAQITPNKEKFFITFLLDEGIKYDFGVAEIKNNIAKLDTNLLKKVVKIKKGKVYNAQMVEDIVDKMIEILSNNGYAFADVDPILNRNKEQKIIDIDFVIKETPRVYVNNINIHGNSHTLDEVIRREMRLKEGDPYNITKINRSRQRITNLGFFEDVDLKVNRIGNGDKIDIDITVKEKKTGELNLGIGYSTVDQLTGNVGIKEINLFGTGREIGANVQKSSNNLSAQINYTKPYFLDYPVDVGYDIFDYKQNKRDTLVYDQNSKGITLRADYSITEFLKHNVKYSYSDQDISNVNVDASQNIKNLAGRFVTSTVGHSLLYDKRDNRLDPRDGYYISVSQDYSGIGGDIKNLKHEVVTGFYQPIVTKDYVFKLLGRFGNIDGISQDVRSNDGFFLGGNNFRGFEFAGVGPRAVVNGTAVGGDIIGGKRYYVGTAELRFPLGLPKEVGISGSLFTDVGTVTGVDQINKQSGQVVDIGSIRASYGVSVSWSSPLGPIRLDFSKVAKKEDFDRSESFRFSFGTTF